MEGDEGSTHLVKWVTSEVALQVKDHVRQGGHLMLLVPSVGPEVAASEAT